MEEEIIAIDLDHSEWRMIALPYLVSLHASAVTCAHHVPNVSADLWQRIEKAGIKQTKHLYSDRVSIIYIFLYRIIQLQIILELGIFFYL